jgi:hypothetical protein
VWDSRTRRRAFELHADGMTHVEVVPLMTPALPGRSGKQLDFVSGVAATELAALRRHYGTTV